MQTKPKTTSQPTRQPTSRQLANQLASQAGWLAGGFRVEGLELQTLQSVVRFLENHVKNIK